MKRNKNANHISEDEWPATGSGNWLFCLSLCGNTILIKKNHLPIPSDYSIRLINRWEGCTPSIDMNCAVVDKNKNLQGPMAWHVAIGEVLGMEIYIDRAVKITENKLTAGLYRAFSCYKTEEKIELIRSHV